MEIIPGAETICCSLVARGRQLQRERDRQTDRQRCIALSGGFLVYRTVDQREDLVYRTIDQREDLQSTEQ